MVDYLLATTPQGLTGQLRRAHDYLFDYHRSAGAAAELSLGMPRRPEQYRSSSLFPIFQMNLPEGFVLEQLRARFAKSARLDAMLLLAMTGGSAGIGRVTLQPPGFMEAAVKPTSLSDLLAHEGTSDLFRQLTDDYLMRTGISGIQPKLLVPEQLDALHYQGMISTPELIVKASGTGYPGLPVNEFVCMSIAREAGIPVAEFHLSEDHRRFVMRRFDRTAEGFAMGFEDMAVLMGEDSDAKYDSSYENIAVVLNAYCAPRYRNQALGQLFDMVALSCMVGNGDAHLKNFGVLYTDPQSDDVRLAPAYDIVCTTCYLPDDGLALSLNRNRNLFTARLDLIDFGKRHCRIDDPLSRLATLLTAMEAILYVQDDLINEVPRLKTELTRRMHMIGELTG